MLWKVPGATVGEWMGACRVRPRGMAFDREDGVTYSSEFDSFSGESRGSSRAGNLPRVEAISAGICHQEPSHQAAPASGAQSGAQQPRPRRPRIAIVALTKACHLPAPSASHMAAIVLVSAGLFCGGHRGRALQVCARICLSTRGHSGSIKCSRPSYSCARGRGAPMVSPVGIRDPFQILWREALHQALLRAVPCESICRKGNVV